MPAYFVTHLATACYVLVLVLGLALKLQELCDLGVVMLAWQAGVAALSQIQAGGNYAAWSIVALGCAWLGAEAWKRLNPRPTRSERRAMRELFGELNAWQMLMRDPRVQTWRPWT